MASEEDSVLKILVTTDTHLGYLERDPIRGEDSFVAWEECLELAKQHEVDFILHGGDLFHDNRPSRKTLFRAMESIRKNCFGPSPVRINLHSDPKINFPTTGQVNYEDQNLNVAVPIFIVHGNHDDPSGDGQHSALDLLAAAGLVNYFGRSKTVDEVEIYPVLLSKGPTKIAIYGIGNIRDERLHRTFEHGKVKWLLPEGDDDWFNLLVIHQNRVAHGPKNFIPDSMLDPRLNLVIWGHEHDCKINPEPAHAGAFYICQPGSSVATSLAEGEAIPKCAGLLEVRGKEFRMTSIPLRRVRPFLWKDVSLGAEARIAEAVHSVANIEPLVLDVLVKKIEAMIKDSTRNSSDPAILPLIRLRVDTAGLDIPKIPPARLALKFVGKVANPNDILLWKKSRSTGTVTKLKSRPGATTSSAPTASNVETILNSLLAEENGPRLSVLNHSILGEALSEYISKSNKQSIEDSVRSQIEARTAQLMRYPPQLTSTRDGVARALEQLSITEGTTSTNTSSQVNPTVDAQFAATASSTTCAAPSPSPSVNATPASTPLRSPQPGRLSQKKTPQATLSNDPLPSPSLSTANRSQAPPSRPRSARPPTAEVVVLDDSSDELPVVTRKRPRAQSSPGPKKAKKLKTEQL